MHLKNGTCKKASILSLALSRFSLPILYSITTCPGNILGRFMSTTDSLHHDILPTLLSRPRCVNTVGRDTDFTVSVQGALPVHATCEVVGQYVTVRRGTPYSIHKQGHGVLLKKVPVKIAALDRHFLTWLLIGWQLCCQPIRRHVRKLLFVC